MQMKCVQVLEIGKFILKKALLRKPLEHEVVIKVAVTGLCRTDLKLIRVGHRDLVLPRIPGEEVVGTVCEVGSEVTAVQTGDLVYVYPGSWCGKCPACADGAENLCRDMEIMGFHRDGGFAEYVTVPSQSVITLPEALEPDTAVFAEPLSCCLNALELAGIQEDMSVGIWGGGPAGTLLSRAAAAIGADPASIEPDQRRRALIKGYASCPDRNFDICIVAVGSKQAYLEAVQKLKPRGRLVVFSGLPPGDDVLEISFNQLHYLEQTVVGAYGCCYRHGVQALDLLSDRAVCVEDMISHRMPLDDLGAALDLVEHRKGMKILLYP
jgi:L-iditol 2-dehydrogenase